MPGIDAQEKKIIPWKDRSHFLHRYYSAAKQALKPHPSNQTQPPWRNFASTGPWFSLRKKLQRPKFYLDAAALTFSSLGTSTFHQTRSNNCNCDEEGRPPQGSSPSSPQITCCTPYFIVKRKAYPNWNHPHYIIYTYTLLIRCVPPLLNASSLTPVWRISSSSSSSSSSSKIHRQTY